HVNHRSVQQLDPLALEQAGARELFVLDATNRPELLLRNVEHGSSLKLASFALAGQSAPHSPSSSGAALDARPAASAFRASFLACARPLSPPALVPAPRCAPISAAMSSASDDAKGSEVCSPSTSETPRSGDAARLRSPLSAVPSAIRRATSSPSLPAIRPRPSDASADAKGSVACSRSIRERPDASDLPVHVRRDVRPLGQGARVARDDQGSASGRVARRRGARRGLRGGEDPRVCAGL